MLVVWAHPLYSNGPKTCCRMRCLCFGARVVGSVAARSQIFGKPLPYSHPKGHFDISFPMPPRSLKLTLTNLLGLRFSEKGLMAFRGKRSHATDTKVEPCCQYERRAEPQYKCGAMQLIQMWSHDTNTNMELCREYKCGPRAMPSK